MAAPYTVPLLRIPIVPAQAQTFAINLNGQTYRFRLIYRGGWGGEGGRWFLDIGDQAGIPILCGIPLSPCCNLLGQHSHLQIGGGGGLFVYNPSAPLEDPSFTGFGESWQMYFAFPTSISAEAPLGLSRIPQGFLDRLKVAKGPPIYIDAERDAPDALARYAAALAALDDDE